jgi:hypothetical protein
VRLYLTPTECESAGSVIGISTTSRGLSDHDTILRLEHASNLTPIDDQEFRPPSGLAECQPGQVPKAPGSQIQRMRIAAAICTRTEASS